MLTHRFNHKKEHPDALKIYTMGSSTKSGPGGIFSSPLNFSFSFCTDSVATGKSTDKSVDWLWPIYVTINELHLKIAADICFLLGYMLDLKIRIK